MGDYEDEFVTSLEAVRRELAILTTTLPDARSSRGFEEAPLVVNRMERCGELSRSLHSLNQLVSDMELEVVDLPPSQQANARARLREYRSLAAGAEKDVAAMKRRCVEADRADLLSRGTRRGQPLEPGCTSDEETTNEPKKIARMATDKARAGTDILREAEHVVNKAHEHADSTMVEMEKQRDTLRRVGQTVRDTDEELTRVNRVMRQMQNLLMKHRLIITGLMAVLILACIAVIYVKVAR